ncbi:mitofilin domain-containing protein [Rhizoctonia solani]|uniref:MICOS complex subunit MIC60 n=1 Tax=Rhizoctonia solani TaxID=456999 RepID=A0A8H8SUS8_9AGAM|nr:mitofilin domain-containing protein [Rhizoctonia solani]QRW17712.1 mitofilin domain-containing protein [Rhizoctonia solani]
MYRRRILLAAPGAKPVVRVQRTRFVKGYATEVPPSASGTLPPPPPPPKKKRGFFRRTLLYTSIFAGTFYGGSTLVALNSERYHDFFVESVPGGEEIMEIAADRGWDRVRLSSIPQRTIDATKDTYNKLSSSISSSSSSSDRARKASQAIITRVERNPNAPDFSTVGKQIEAKAFQFSEGVSELAKEVEAALRGESKPGPIGSDTHGNANADTKTLYPDAAPKRDVEVPPQYEKEWTPPKASPGLRFAPAQVEQGAREPPKGKDVLPLLAPKLNASEPVIAQLAKTIDSLAAFVQANPSALDSAQGVLSTAQIDLEKLGERTQKLEKKLDEQAKEYEDKLLGLEMESREKLDKQEEDWKGVFEEERRKIVAAYRQKLEKELETQGEIINQRLKEEVMAQGIELQRRWIREIKVRVEAERAGRLAKLDSLSTSLKKLERTTADNASPPGRRARGFRDELRVLKSVAGESEGGEILDGLLKSQVPDEGVEPRADLTEWFTTSVAPAVRKAALVPDTSAGVLSHLASSVFSALRPAPAPSLASSGNDVLSRIARAEYYLSLKDLDSATREVNQLEGWPKRLVKDWLEAARKRLEVEQALDVVQTGATLASLLVL